MSTPSVPIASRRRWPSLILIALLVLAACYVVDCNRKLAGALSRAEMIERLKQGDTIVQAIYNYRNRTGSWPTDELFPELVRAPKPDRHWHYVYRGDSDPPIVFISPAMHTLGTYTFPIYAEGEPAPANLWIFSGDSIVRWDPIESTAVPSLK